MNNKKSLWGFKFFIEDYYCISKGEEGEENNTEYPFMAIYLLMDVLGVKYLFCPQGE